MTETSAPLAGQRPSAGSVRRPEEQPARSHEVSQEQLRQLTTWGRDHLWMQGRTARDLQDSGEYRLMVRGEGCHIFDIWGHRLIDGTSSSYVKAVGHGWPEIGRAIAAQVEALAFTPVSFGYVTEPAIRVARKIAELAPGTLSRTFFCGGGGEAVEIATKLARQYQRLKGHLAKRKLISFRPEYHGSSHVGMCLGQHTSRDSQLFEPFGGSVVQVDAPDCDRCPWGHHADSGECCMHSVRQLENTIVGEGADQIAALVATPFRAGGAQPPAAHWDRVRDICQRHDILIIADEVTMGFGRLGSWFGMERFGVTPDIMAIGKGLTSGELPVGAVVAREEIAQAFDAEGAGLGQFQHGVTFGRHPVVMAAALANLQLMERLGAVANARRLEGHFHALVRRLEEDHPIVGKTCGGLGFMEMIPLVKDRDTGARFKKRRDARFFARLAQLVWERGLSIRLGPSIVLAPPLIATEDILEEVVSILDEAFSVVEKEFSLGG